MRLFRWGVTHAAAVAHVVALKRQVGVGDGRRLGLLQCRFQRPFGEVGVLAAVPVGPLQFRVVLFEGFLAGDGLTQLALDARRESRSTVPRRRHGPYILRYGAFCLAFINVY